MEWIVIFLMILVTGNGQELDDDADDSDSPFTPTVTATCQLLSNRMVITLTTTNPFYGLLLSSNQRNNSNCFTYGSGHTQTNLTLNMLASINDYDYCGVSINHKTSEKTAQLSVRQNRVLELAQDKNYLVSCSKFDSSPPSIPKPARLSLYDQSNREALEVIRNHPYKLKIKTLQNNFRVRNCFAFNNNNQVPLIDSNGCPESRIISRFTIEDNTAEATIYSMFKFQESNKVTVQCHVLFCTDCINNTCSEIPAVNFRASRLIGSNDTDAIASTTVSVLEPGDKSPLTLATDDEICTGRFCPTWLLWLCIMFAVLFLLMLLVNLFLCTALTCTCTRTELVEKDPSIIEDYDPYNNRFDSGSQYNSRYSINNKAYSDMSDHYARPNSRFSK